MKKLTLFLSASIFCFSQDLSQNNQNLNNSHTFTSASFFNYGTSGYEIDGFIEFQIKNRFFIESSINYEIGNSFNFGDHTLRFSSSIGAIKNLTKGSHAVGGLSMLIVIIYGIKTLYPLFVKENPRSSRSDQNPTDSI